MKHLSLVFILFVVCFSARGQDNTKKVDSLFTQCCKYGKADSAKTIVNDSVFFKVIYPYTNGKILYRITYDKIQKIRRETCYSNNGNVVYEAVFDYKKGELTRKARCDDGKFIEEKKQIPIQK